MRALGGATVRSRASRRSGYLLVVAMVAAVMGPLTAVSPAAAAAGGTVSGTVTKFSGGNAAGVTVSVDDGFSPVLSAVTAANGTYSVANVPAGFYQVCFVPTPASGLATECYDNQPDKSWADDIEVEDGVVTGGIDANLEQGASLAGTVTKAGPLAVASVEVELMSEDIFSVVAATTTDGAGAYHFDAVRPGNYQVCFTPPPASGLAGECYDNRPLGFFDGTTINLGPGEARTGVDAMLAAPASIAGKVTGPTGANVANATVTAYRMEFGYPNYVASDFTLANGRYTLGDLAPGTYRICFEPPFGDMTMVKECYIDAPDAASGDDVTVVEGQNLTGIHAQLAAPGFVAGTVTATGGGAAAGVGVRVTPVGCDGFGCETETNTDGAGHYSVAVGAGSYHVCFEPDFNSPLLGECFEDQPLNSAAKDPVAVVADATTTVDAELATGGTLSGIVNGPAGTPLEFSPVVVSGANAYRYATTDAAGAFSVVGLPTGSYQVCASPPSGQGANMLAECYDNQPMYNGNPTPIPVVAGQVTSGITLQLDAPGAISGTVRSPGNNLLAGANVLVRTVTGASAGNAITDGSGNYTVSGLRAGTYEVCFGPPAGANMLIQCYDGKALGNEDPVVVAAGATTTGIDAKFAVGGSIKGKITKAGGVPVVGATVSTGTSSALSDASGDYAIVALTTGTYSVCVSPPLSEPNLLRECFDNRHAYPSYDPVAVTTGVATNGIDIQLDPGAKVTGTVTTTGGVPVAGVAVAAEPVGQSFSGIGATVTAADGTYTIQGLPTGALRVRFTPAPPSPLAPQYFSNDYSRAAAEVIWATEGQTLPGIDALLVAGGTISGTVTGMADAPVPGASVTASGPEYNSAAATTDASGNYELTGLIPGQWTVCVSPPYPSTLLDRCYDAQVDREHADPVAVTLGATTPDIDLHLVVEGSISGTVTGPGGAPVGNAYVYVVPVSASGSGGSAYGQTGPDGTYTVGGLPTGLYSVCFSSTDFGDGLADQCYDNHHTAYSGGDPVAVVAGNATTGIDAELILGGSLSGTVTGPGGAPLGGVAVQLSMNGYGYGFTTATDADGKYRFDGLPSGLVTVCFDPSGTALAQECFDGQAGIPDATPVAVTTGSETTGIDASLVASGAVAGTVTTAGGAPVPGAYVSVQGGGRSFSATAAADGTYMVPGIPPGSYEVCFTALIGSVTRSQCHDGAAGRSTATLVTVSSGATLSGIDAEFPDPAVTGTVTGTVTGPGGTPVVGLTVGLTGVEGTSGSKQVTTGAGGAYSAAVAAGTYRVCFYPPPTSPLSAECFDDDFAGYDPVVVTAGATTAEVDASLVVGGSIAGTISGPSGALIGVSVTVVGGGSYRTATSGPGGLYVVAGLTPGDVFACFSRDAHVSECYDNQPAGSFGSSTPIPVTAGTVTNGIDALLAVAPTGTGSIKGTVTRTGGAAVPGAGVRVSPSGESGGYGTTYSTDGDGHFQASGLPAGDYDVCFTAPEPLGLRDECFNDQFDPTAATAVTVVAGAATTGIDAVLSDAGAIAGTVQGPGDLPLSGVTVRIETAAGLVVTSTTTEGDGRYEVVVDPGSYRVHFVPPVASGLVPQWFDHVTTLAASAVVTVAATQTVSGVDGDLVGGGSIAGHVTKGGAPFTSGTIQARSLDGTVVVAQTGLFGGTYELTNLPAGSYQVWWLSADGVTASQIYNAAYTVADGDPVVVVAGGTTADIDFAVVDGGTITGTIRLDGLPLAGAYVALEPPAGSPWGQFGYGVSPQYPTYGCGPFGCIGVPVFAGPGGTGPDGTYSFTGLPPGDYRVAFWQDGSDLDGPPDEYFDRKASQGVATPVAVTLGETRSGIDGVFPLAAPDSVPTNVAGTPGNAQVVVTWDAPANNGGSPFTAYTVTAAPGGATCGWTAGPLTCTVTGLTNGTAYTFTVTATNGLGTSAPSSPSGPVTPRTTPGAPTGATATAGAGQASVSWTAPAANGGAPITGYTVVSTPGGNTCSWTAGPLTCTVVGLTNGTPYTFVVRATNAAGNGPNSAPSAAVTPRTVPSAPTNVGGGPDDGKVSVFWSAPGSDGGSPVTGYTVTASPGGNTCSWTSGPLTCTVNGLTNGTPYTFVVKATNALGTGPDSAPSGPIVPNAGPKFHALVPARILDTRPPPDQTGLAGKFTAGQARLLTVAGHGGVPATGATAVIINVTAVNPSENSFLSITPDLPAVGAPISTSSLNLSPNTVRPNLVVAKLNALGQISIYNNSGAVDVLADVVGWFDDGTIAGDSLTAVTPSRILDTRPGPDQAGLAGKFNPVQARVLQVTGHGGVPAGATAVTLNVTSVGPSADSFLSLTPDTLAPGQVPSTSNLNIAANQVRPNLVVVKLNAQGQVTIFNNSGTVDVLADVVGYFSASEGGPVQTVTPSRILDTRPGPEQTGLAGKFTAVQARVLQVTGHGGVPAGAKAVWLNVTSVSPSQDSFLSLTPDVLAPGQVPGTSNLNLAAGTVVPNLVLVKLSPTGTVTIYNNSGNVDVLADTVAYVP